MLIAAGGQIDLRSDSNTVRVSASDVSINAGENGMTLESQGIANINAQQDLNIHSENSNVYVRSQNLVNFQINGQNSLYVNSNGVGIGRTNPQYRLHVNGDTMVTGTVFAGSFRSYSDRRLKTDIRPFTNSLQKVLNLRAVKYRWNTVAKTATGGVVSDLDEEQIGFIAQEVEEIIPEIVHESIENRSHSSQNTTATSYKTIDCSKMSAILADALKEEYEHLQEQEHMLKKAIEEQSSAIGKYLESLSSEIEALKNNEED
jgi:hypothetical protein